MPRRFLQGGGMICSIPFLRGSLIDVKPRACVRPEFLPEIRHGARYRPLPPSPKRVFITLLMSAQLPVYVCTFGSNGNSRTCERTGIVGNDAYTMSARLELARVRSAVRRARRRASSLHQRLQHPPTKRGLHGGSSGQCSMKNAGPARDIVRRNNSIRAPARDPPTRGMLIEGGARADRAGIKGGGE